MGVSTATSVKLTQPAVARPIARLLTATTVLAVIDFPEKVVVGLDERVARIEFHSLFVGLPSVIKTAELLVADAQVVPGGGVCGVSLGGAFPPIGRFLPKALLRDGHAEL